MRHAEYPTQEQILNDIVDYKVFDNRIIVAGTRGFNDYEFFSNKIKEIIAGIEGNFIFYSGMASSGADKLIVDFCKKEGYLYHPCPADWDRFGKGAGFIRNGFMASTATWLIAFHDGNKQKNLFSFICNVSKRPKKDVVCNGGLPFTGKSQKTPSCP